jgi:hypothetical protein
MTVTSKYYASRDFQDLSTALSYRIYGKLRNAQMKWVPLSSCQDYVIAGGYSLSRAGHKAHVWCAGYTKSYGLCARPEKIYSVRGPLSQARAKQHMNITVPAAGDPLLLMSELYEVPEAAPKPCFFEKLDGTLSKIKLASDVRRITVNDSLDTILTSLKNASYVVTDLLEGLVISDSFGVKSTYVSNTSPSFAVRDYLENFSTSDKDIVESGNISNCNLGDLRCRNIVQLKSSLIATLPDV